MSNIDIISMAVKNLFKRKLRTFLTILGVIVGTGAIVIMISLGIAMNESFDSQLQQMGDLSLIRVYDPSYWGSSSGQSKDVELTKAVCEDFKKIKGVKAVTPIAQTNFNFVSGKYQANITVRGIDASVMSEFKFKLLDGRLLDETDSDSFNFVFGNQTAYDFMKPNSRNYYRYNSEEEKEPDVDVMNDKIKIRFGTDKIPPSDSQDNSEEQTRSPGKMKEYKINAVGYLDTEDYENDWYAYVSLSQFEKMQSLQQKYNKESGRNQNKKNSYNQAYVKCDSIDVVSKVQEEIKEMGYEAESNMDYIKSMQEISNSLQALLGAIGAVSLFIAAIGITNTMIMAIYERTREIGIMKVIGAQIKDIKKLFLLEAMLIGFLGGVFGILISLLVSVILNNFQIPFLTMMSWSEEAKVSSIPLWLCILALCFSTFVGLISGYFPARRAMKLSALSAIKTE